MAVDVSARDVQAARARRHLRRSSDSPLEIKPMARLWSQIFGDMPRDDRRALLDLIVANSQQHASEASALTQRLRDLQAEVESLRPPMMSAERRKARDVAIREAAARHYSEFGKTAASMRLAQDLARLCPRANESHASEERRALIKIHELNGKKPLSARRIFDLL